ncbi:hypothetical protein QWY90_07755 [Flavobacterium paronense]|uniref:Sugar-binding protein n=1 Tax=Flavobacterium paronense TaxID=1392775 RepID=A0ABV5GGR2_9FLAO|nr:hypothetical protein [Flavobacterium paronense]MDN3677207.1 hypothetical protein [Flavobacterium paronense]
MRYYCWIISLFFVVVFFKKGNNQENKFSQELTEKLLDPIAVDSFAEPTYFKSLELFNIEIKMKIPASGYKTYSTYAYGEDFIIRGKDTLYLEYDVAFTKNNLIQKMESYKSKDEYFYDDKNNLVLRQLVSKRKDESSTYHRFHYDNYGNLKSFLSYRINADGTYKFEHYKEYYYSKDKTGITVTIKGIEEWSTFHKLNVVKKFDNAGRILSEKTEDYNPLSGKEASHFKEYKHVGVNNSYLVSEEKMYMSFSPNETLTNLYEYNAEGKEIVAKRIENMVKYNLEYKVIKEYAGNNHIKSVSTANSNNEQRVASTYPAKKSGLQETYVYTYNKQNDVIKEEHTIYSGKKEDYDVTTNAYEYDTKGNWNYKKSLQKYPYIKYEEDYGDDNGSKIFVRKFDYGNIETPAIPKPDPKAEQLKNEVLEKHPLQ